MGGSVPPQPRALVATLSLTPHSQDVHDDADGPAVHRPPVPLPPHHLRSCQRQKSNHPPGSPATQPLGPGVMGSGRRPLEAPRISPQGDGEWEVQQQVVRNGWYGPAGTCWDPALPTPACPPSWLSPTQVLRSATGLLNEPVLQLGQVEVTDDDLGVLQAIIVHQVLQLLVQGL